MTPEIVCFVHVAHTVRHHSAAKTAEWLAARREMPWRSLDDAGNRLLCACGAHCAPLRLNPYVSTQETPRRQRSSGVGGNPDGDGHALVGTADDLQLAAAEGLNAVPHGLDPAVLEIAEL